MTRIVFIVTGLEVGGAEAMLVKLLSHLDRSRFEPIVVAMRSGGSLGREIEALGVPLVELGLSGVWSAPRAVLQLARLAKELRPKIIQGWMYHGNLGALVMHRALKRNAKLVWSVRVTADSRAFEKRLTRVIVSLGARYSERPSHIIYNSSRSADQHAKIGYRGEGNVVIPNGFDTDLFKPSRLARETVRERLGIPSQAQVIGIVGRFHPIKDHTTFVEAAALVIKELPDSHFLFIGRGLEKSNSEITSLIKQLELKDRCHLLGNQQNLHELYPAMDVHVSSSVSEGFPNVLGEAMSCGIPCVATDVGDSALVIGDTGEIVAKSSPVDLGRAIVNMLGGDEDLRRGKSERARNRVVERFSLGSVVSEYEAIFDRALSVERSRVDDGEAKEPTLVGERKN
ncbi:MAG: glycosyltransferase [Chlorobia bacterium]|nr:glycosyltransferase [Fimbriimonadaceae bacterium]